MKRKKKIPRPVIRRLPKYHRYLKEFLIDDVDRISSKKLGVRSGFTANQIRQDLNWFGELGQPGLGYNVKELLNKISRILGLGEKYKMIIIGAGNVGQAIASYIDFQVLNFKLVGIFDANPKIIGLKIQDITVEGIDQLVSFLKVTPIDIGIICTTTNNAQMVADTLVDNGIIGIWNFSSVDLEVEEETVLENVNLNQSLLTLRCLMNHRTYL